MTDDRFLRGFRAFDAAVAPDPEFAERLFGELAGELGFRPDAAAAPTLPPSLGARVRRAFRIDWRPFPPAQMRLVYLAAAVALLAAALVGSALIAAQLFRAHPSPLDIVRQSQAVVANPPAFALVYRNPDGTLVRFSTDGRGTWRIEDPDGSFGLWDGNRQGFYNAQGRTWGIADTPVTSPPFVPLMLEWAWRTTNQPGAVGEVTPIECADAEWIDEATVAGRPADHVRCPSWHDTEYWIDRDTALVLRFVAGPETPGWTDEPPAGTIRGIEVVSLDLSPPNAAAFSWDGPVGAYDESNPPASTVLAVGAPVRAISATTVDGDPLALPARDRPTAVLFTTNASRGRWGRTYEAFTTAAAAHPGVSSSIIFTERAGTVAGYRDLHPTSVPLVGDWDMETWQAWGVTIPGTLVLVDAEGTAVRLGYEELDAAGIESLLGALEAGTPIPEVTPVTPAPAPSFMPPPSEAPVGAALPTWTGLLAGGGTFDAAALAGRPYVLTQFAGSECETCIVDAQLDGFKAADDALGDRAAFVLLGSGEATPGATARQMARLGIDVPVVMDWDGTISAAIDEAVHGYTSSTIVVDAEGRLAATFETFPGEAAIAEVLDRLEASATPAP